jgi:uncharacterized protein (TIGR02453 family)
MDDGEFTGFPEGTFKFLRGLGKNNSKVWFDEHRADYDNFYIAPARAFVSTLGPRLKKISLTVAFDPKFNGSIFRINRDVRFARDKTPYRTNLDLWFWHGDRGGWSRPGFFFRLGADKVGFGVGVHQLPKPELDAYREAVVDDRSGKSLVKVIAGVTAAGPYVVKGANRKAVPRGFDPGHARANLLLHEGLWVDFETKPEAAGKAAFVDQCVKHFAAMWPIGKWLLTEVAATK